MEPRVSVRQTRALSFFFDRGGQHVYFTSFEQLPASRVSPATMKIWLVSACNVDLQNGAALGRAGREGGHGRVGVLSAGVTT